ELPTEVQDEPWYGSNLWFIGLFIILTILHIIVFVGGRARLRWTFLVVVGMVAFVAVGGWLIYARDGGTQAAAGLVVVALVAWAGLWVFHWRCGKRPENRSLAWNGAGASVMLGTATM